MATNSDIVKDALGLIGVLRIAQPADPNQGAQALRVMNDMFFEWEAIGISLGYSSQSSTTADFPLDASLLQVIKSNLAVRLCPYYEKAPTPVLVAMASAGYDRISRDAALAARIESRTDNLPVDEGARHGSRSSSILTGE